MKLVKQTLLSYKQGSSDKVYEISLCEVGVNPGRYVVNYRYGRRGSHLREGAQTVSPVSHAEAEKVFAELVQSKIRKGYQDIAPEHGGEASRGPGLSTALPASGSAREQQVLSRLARAVGSPAPDKKKRGGWPLERVVFRAGELRLAAAVPQLLRLLDESGQRGGSALRSYCIAWALGQCGEGVAAAKEALARLHQNGSAPEMVRRIALEGVRRLGSDEDRAALAREQMGRLPAPLREILQRGPAEDLAHALQAHLEQEPGPADKEDRFAALDALYLIDSEPARAALLSYLHAAPFVPGAIRRLRHLYKAAEFRRDAEVFGLLGYRFEKVRTLAARESYARLDTGEYRPLREVYSDRSLRGRYRYATLYGRDTRTYLRRRTWRTLRVLGEQGDPDYVKMAVGVLLPFADADADAAPRPGYEPFAGYWAFNHVLFGRSKRIRPQRNAKAFRAVGRSRTAEPAVREESFPELWEQRPQGLLHLLAESRCLQVHHFAALALRDCRSFLRDLDVEALIMLLSRPYEVTQRLGLELALSWWDKQDPAAPNLDLVLALCECALQEARAAGYGFIDARRGHYLQHADFVLALVRSAQAETRAYARQLLLSAQLPGPAARALVGRIIAHLLTLRAGPADEARDIAGLLLQCFAAILASIGIEVILDLLSHPLLPVQEVGLRLLSQQPDTVLLLRADLLHSLCCHERAEIRSAVRAAVKRLAAEHPLFGERVTAGLIGALLKKEPHQGVHRDLLHILREDLSECAEHLPKDRVLALLWAKSQPAQELGGHLLRQHLDWADELPTTDIVKLASHELRAVRELSWELLRRVVPRLGASAEEMARAVRFLDARWEDSRQAAFALFRAAFGGAELSPAVLISICDSVRPDVQLFGRELCARFFAEADGHEYLLKLSEHPAADLQLFVTNYLERYAADNPARLRELVPYFLSALCRVNRGRVAKSRLYDFLLREGEKSEEAARVVADIFARQSATIAVTYRARAIEGMLRLQTRYPGIAMPLICKPAAVRHAL